MVTITISVRAAGAPTQPARSCTMALMARGWWRMLAHPTATSKMAAKVSHSIQRSCVRVRGILLGAIAYQPLGCIEDAVCLGP